MDRREPAAEMPSAQKTNYGGIQSSKDAPSEVNTTPSVSSDTLLEKKG